MAYYQETHPKKSDTVQKFDITPADIEFFRNLQYVLNTQDNMGNADPLFWVIRASKEKPVTTEQAPDDYDFITIADSDDPDTNIRSLEDFYDICNSVITPENEKFMSIEYVPDGEVIIEDTIEDRILYEISELDQNAAEILNLLADYPHRFYTCYYRTEPEIIPDTLFLTHSACERHLKQNAHNYPEDAHAYAMTAQRSPEYETLLHLIKTINWNNIQLQTH